MNKRTKRMPNAALKLKQKTVSVFHKKGMEEAIEFSGYEKKTIYKWVQAMSKGELCESKSGRPRITKSQIIAELENPHFIENLNSEEKDEALILMRELLL